MTTNLASRNRNQLTFLLILLCTLTDTALLSKWVQAKPGHEIEQIAKQTSVRIQDLTHEGYGSGLIIHQQQQTYTVLTAAHVVDDSRSTNQPTDGELVIVTPDNHTIPVDNRSIQLFPQLDLAIFEFQTDRSYPIAQLADSTRTQVGEKCHVYGFPTELSLWRQGLITANLQQTSNGADLACSVISESGMSGGPIFNQQGQVVGITSSNVGIKEFPRSSDFTMGTPIHHFLNAVPDINPQLNFPKPQEVQKSAPQTANGFFLLGIKQFTKFTLKDTKDTISLLTEAIKLDPDYGHAYYIRGHMHVALKNYPKAIADYNKAISFYPDYAKAYFSRGKAYLRSGNQFKAKAKEDLQFASTLANRQEMKGLHQHLQSILKGL